MSEKRIKYSKVKGPYNEIKTKLTMLESAKF